MANNDKHTLAGEMPGNVVFGIQGESAYQVAVRNGFEGTEEEWLKSLSGPAGVGITDMYDMHASQSAAGTQSLAGKRHTLTVNLSDGTARSFSFKDGDNGQRGRGVYPWDLNASSSFVDDEGITHYRDGVTLPDGVLLLDGDLLLTGTGDVYRVEQWNNIYGMTVKHLYNIAGSAPGSGGNADLTADLKTALINYYTHVMPTFDDTNGLVYVNAILTALGAETRGESGGEEEPDEPVTPEKTLSSISATYSGGDVAVGTAVSALTGIVVTAHYSDGTSETVTGYTLSGTIAEGSNTVTVSYGGKTTTFAVTGVAESGGETEGVIVVMGATVDPTPTIKWYSDGGSTTHAPLKSYYGAIASVDAFGEDTTVKITFDSPDRIVDSFTIASANLGESGEIANCTAYFAVNQGTGSWTTGGQAVHREFEYTIKAGYHLLLAGYTISTNSTATITVEVV